jgi:1,4-dihydroxy-6-naphthoate synthase
MQLNLAYSPCPNDTFVFSSIHAGNIKLGPHTLHIHHLDIESLNQYALEGRFEISKMSFYTWLFLKGKYRLLQAGNALGYGCGPVLLSQKKIDLGELPSLKVVLPGEHTSANLLFRLFSPSSKNLFYTTYDRIIPALQSGEADCGVVIHEGRFVYEKENLRLVRDLGEWWETTTGSPIPLGAIGIRADFPQTLDHQVESLIRQSLELSRKDPQSALPYIRSKALELDDVIIQNHINTFVNKFSFDLGSEGLNAINALRTRAQAAGLI